MKKDHFIRDPVHGSIPLSKKERQLIEHMAFQRLRNIKQVGFADVAFPGATHTRFSHSLGAMHLATRVFDKLFPKGKLPENLRSFFRQLVRLTMLLHDIGHPPLSHTTEMLMPLKKALSLPESFKGNAEEKATHEDYTLKILLDSSLSNALNELFKEEGITTENIALLLSNQTAHPDFRYNNLDFTPVLKQIISSEIDADRMDYLQRDSLHCGVNYGKFDLDWLIDNLIPVQQNEAVYLGIRSRAIFSFEDFLLSRYHMFASVYLHHTPVIYEAMLEKFFLEEEKNLFLFPGDIEAYLQIDDSDILQALKKSASSWAHRITHKKPLMLLYEQNDSYKSYLPSHFHKRLISELGSLNIPFIATYSKSQLSKYSEKPALPLYVLTPATDKIPLETYTPLFERYKNAVQFHRVYVAPESKKEAKLLYRSLIRELRSENVS